MARRKPFRQLSKPQQARIRRTAQKLGVSVREVRSNTAMAQQARGHRPPPGRRESEVRREVERHRAAIVGRLTSDEVQEIRRYFVSRALRRGYSREEGETAYRRIIPALRNREFAVFERLAETLSEWPTDQIMFEFGRLRGQEPDPERINRDFVEFLNQELGIDLTDSNDALLWRLSPKRNTPQPLAA